MIILHPKYTSELKNDDRLSLPKFIEHVSKLFYFGLVHFHMHRIRV